MKRVDSSGKRSRRPPISDPRTSATAIVIGHALRHISVPPEQLTRLAARLAPAFTASADPDMAIRNFVRLLEATREPAELVDFCLAEAEAIDILAALFSTSQYFSDVIISHPDYVSFLWERGHKPLEPCLLTMELLAEIDRSSDPRARALALIRQSRQRELLRIGYRDIVLGEPLEVVTRAISDLADTLIDVALAVALQKHRARRGEPLASDGRPVPVTVLAMGKLGGQELNYSSDIDLMFVYESDGRTAGSSNGAEVSNADFFAYVVQDAVRLLAENSPEGQGYRVDLRLRPFGDEGPLAMNLQQTLAYYQKHGRTWERQALVKLRPVAGHAPLGHRLVASLESFVYRRYTSFVEINQIKAMKRRIEEKTRDSGGDETDLKTGHGGIRDIEFVTQFLQLLYGGDDASVRGANTLVALQRLGEAGCLNQDELSALDTAYRFLRKAEHRLQFMFDLQTHRIRKDEAELEKLALRLGYASAPEGGPAPGQQFRHDLQTFTMTNRGILKRLMHDLFTGEAEEPGEPETDLILDPSPTPAKIQAVLGRFAFRDVTTAYRNLRELGREVVPFLSSVRCQHFLASVAPALLHAVAQTPDPDMALTNLEHVTRSLGAKGVLWESFAVHRPLLQLYVELCSWSGYLSQTLINNPGMIDELLDSLIMARAPTREELARELESLIGDARDIEPTLHGFRNTHVLRIGVDDILGKNPLRTTTGMLTDLAETIVRCVAQRVWLDMVQEFGRPRRGTTDCPMALIGLGKFGGREMTYQSDLDLILVYQSEGATTGARSTGRSARDHAAFYHEYMARLKHRLDHPGPHGRLYRVDLRLRPRGGDGDLACSLRRFEEYHAAGGGALWERMALTRARVVAGDRYFGERVMQTIRQCVSGRPWDPVMVHEIHAMRRRLEESRLPTNLKRRRGGLVDVEFAVQLCQMKHGAAHPAILQVNIWDALEAIARAGLWPPERINHFREGYTFLRTVESRLRIVHNLDTNDVPEDPIQLTTLAHRLGFDPPDERRRLLAAIEHWTDVIRSEYAGCLAEEQVVIDLG